MSWLRYRISSLSLKKLFAETPPWFSYAIRPFFLWGLISSLIEIAHICCAFMGTAAMRFGPVLTEDLTTRPATVCYFYVILAFIKGCKVSVLCYYMLNLIWLREPVARGCCDIRPDFFFILLAELSIGHATCSNLAGFANL